MKCDELKTIFATPHPKMKNPCDGAIEVYPRGDVDIAIYELKNLIELAGITNTKLEREVKKYERAFNEKAEEKRQLEEQLRKQKRKRCIAMARACHLMLRVLLFPSKEYFRKWAERGNKWIDLADKFKG